MAHSGALTRFILKAPWLTIAQPLTLPFYVVKYDESWTPFATAVRWDSVFTRMRMFCDPKNMNRYIMFACVSASHCDRPYLAEKCDELGTTRRPAGVKHLVLLSLRFSGPDMTTYDGLPVGTTLSACLLIVWFGIRLVLASKFSASKPCGAARDTARGSLNRSDFRVERRIDEAVYLVSFALIDEPREKMNVNQEDPRRLTLPVQSVRTIGHELLAVYHI
ncbi:hypothetical protein ARMGADRAFT_1064206 [Armillaria gallica]|uniref:Uncharacterized protein n=1 Tax=Armillaria gallica TaxID=47427 RepID=A0A2H3D8Y3_ARMGA|nr:hypothetical protein ARMGADRAFT_1064206 [Armillaria gallica]